MAAEAADGTADAGLQLAEVSRAKAARGMLLQPSPEAFVRVEFRGVGGQTVNPEAVSIEGQSGSNPSRAVRIEAIPKQEERSGDRAQQMLDEANHLGAFDGAWDQMQVDMGVGRNRREGGQLRPVEAVAQGGGLA